MRRQGIIRRRGMSWRLLWRPIRAVMVPINLNGYADQKRDKDKENELFLFTG